MLVPGKPEPALSHPYTFSPREEGSFLQATPGKEGLSFLRASSHWLEFVNQVVQLLAEVQNWNGLRVGYGRERDLGVRWEEAGGRERGVSCSGLGEVSPGNKGWGE